MLLTLLALGSLLNQALVEVVHHGEILQGLRWTVHGWAESLRFPPWRWAVTPLRSLHCPFCLSHWTGLAAAMALATAGGSWWWGFLLWLPIVRGSNLLNDVVGDRCRSPGSGDDPKLSQARPQDLEAKLLESLGPGHRVVSDEEETTG